MSTTSSGVASELHRQASVKKGSSVIHRSNMWPIDEEGPVDPVLGEMTWVAVEPGVGARNRRSSEGTSLAARAGFAYQDRTEETVPGNVAHSVKIDCSRPVRVTSTLHNHRGAEERERERDEEEPIRCHAESDRGRQRRSPVPLQMIGFLGVERSRCVHHLENQIRKAPSA